MKVLKRIVQGLIGLLLAAAAAVAVSTWVYPETNDELVLYRGFRLGVAGVGAGIALLVLLSFANGWIGVRNRKGGARFPGTLLNGIGFGLLPGIAVWKAFEHLTAAGAGTEIPEKIPQAAWFTAEGRVLPCRIELALAVLAFGAVILWLVLRKEDLPENGDLLPVSLTLWGTARCLTGVLHATRRFFPDVPWAVTAIALAVMGICLTGWIRRSFRLQKNTGYAYACIPVFAVFAAGILLQDLQVLSVNPLADGAIRIVCALLAMKAVICMGRVSR